MCGSKPAVVALDIGPVNDAPVALGAAEHGTVAWTPGPDYHGPASFGYTVAGGEAQAVATIQVAPVNDAPVAAGHEDHELVFPTADLLANDFDAELAATGDVLTVTGERRAARLGRHRSRPQHRTSPWDSAS